MLPFGFAIHSADCWICFVVNPVIFARLEKQQKKDAEEVKADAPAEEVKADAPAEEVKAEEKSE